VFPSPELARHGVMLPQSLGGVVDRFNRKDGDGNCFNRKERKERSEGT
jgi:hypothetical protein